MMLNLKKHGMAAIASVVTIATVAGIGLTALPSFAQMPLSVGGGFMTGRHAMSAEQISKWEQRLAKRWAELHDRLKISDAQEGAWKSFTGKMALVRSDTAGSGEHEREKLNTPERLDELLDVMKKMQARMADRIAATKELYAVLSPEQQKIFDQEFSRLMERGFRRGRFFSHDRGN